MSMDRRLIGAVAAVAAALWLLSLLKGVLMPFVAGALVAYLLDPLADRLERWRCSRVLATVMITAGFVLALVLLLLLLVPLIQAQIAGFVERLPRYLDLLRTALPPLLERFNLPVAPEDAARLRDFASAHVGDILRWAGNLLKGLFSGGAAVLDVLSLVVITPLVAFYLLLDWDRVVGQVDGLLPRAMAPTVRALVAEIDRTLSAFVRGQSLVCLLLGLFYAGGLMLAGLDFGLLVGLGAGLVSFVPFLGSLLGLTVSVGIAIAQFPGWIDVAIVVAVFLSGQALEGNVLTPRIVGRSVGLHPVWVIFALLAGGALFGFTGVLLAVPAAAAIGVLVRHGTRAYRDSAVYRGAETGPEPGPGPGPEDGAA